jgi:hypothetical protein
MVRLEIEPVSRDPRARVHPDAGAHHAEHERGHRPDEGAEPPANPTNDRRAEEDEQLFQLELASGTVV